VSSAVAAALAAATPAYQPTAKTSGASALSDLDEKPRNGIIRLPRYTVLEPKVRQPHLDQMLTPKAKLDLAMKMNPGLHVGSLPFLTNDGVALEMLEESRLQERRQRTIDLVSLLPKNVGTGDGSAATNSLVQDAMNPRSSWTNTSPEVGPGH
jgi:hypothetical protein